MLLSGYAKWFRDVMEGQEINVIHLNWSKVKHVNSVVNLFAQGASLNLCLLLKVLRKINLKIMFFL